MQLTWSVYSFQARLNLYFQLSLRSQWKQLSFGDMTWSILKYDFERGKMDLFLPQSAGQRGEMIFSLDDALEKYQIINQISSYSNCVSGDQAQLNTKVFCMACSEPRMRMLQPDHWWSTKRQLRQ